MRLSDIGNSAAREWIRTVTLRSNMKLDEWVVMPDHFHCIIGLTADTEDGAGTEEAFGKPVPNSIPTIVRSFKSAVTKEFHRIPGCAHRRLWQRNYWEHRIRNPYALHNMRRYIRQNPIRWRGT
jgi:REP element-mobilizing transposase RayT